MRTKSARGRQTSAKRLSYGRSASPAPVAERVCRYGPGSQQFAQNVLPLFDITAVRIAVAGCGRIGLLRGYTHALLARQLGWTDEELENAAGGAHATNPIH